jgi:hypothetical protein
MRFIEDFVPPPKGTTPKARRENRRYLSPAQDTTAHFVPTLNRKTPGIGAFRGNQRTILCWAGLLSRFLSPIELTTLEPDSHSQQRRIWMNELRSLVQGGLQLVNAGQARVCRPSSRAAQSSRISRRRSVAGFQRPVPPQPQLLTSRQVAH